MSPLGSPVEQKQWRAQVKWAFRRSKEKVLCFEVWSGVWTGGRKFKRWLPGPPRQEVAERKTPRRENTVQSKHFRVVWWLEREAKRKAIKTEICTWEAYAEDSRYKISMLSIILQVLGSNMELIIKGRASYYCISVSAFRQLHIRIKEPRSTGQEE